MSTRANIIIKEGTSKVIFYRHSDGYPSGTLPTLNIFMEWLNSGKIRNNISQASGWLIILGALEYGSLPKVETKEVEYFKGHVKLESDLTTIEPPIDWKMGGYEITTCIHGDIEYLYTIDLLKKTLVYKEV